MALAIALAWYAAVAFEKSRALGRNDSRIYYNRGSVYFRLEMFDKAEDNYRMAARFPDAQAISWYNLGLVAMRRQNWRQAAGWFSRATRSAAPPNLQSLSQFALVRSQHQIDIAPRLHFRIDGGHNSNIVGWSDTTLSPYAGQGATFLGVQAGLDSRRRDFSGNSARAVASLCTNRYSDKSAVNISTVSGGLVLNRPASGGGWEAFFGGGKYWYGGNDYQKIQQLSAARTLGWQAAETRIGHELMRIDSLDPAYRGLTGLRRTTSVDGNIHGTQTRFLVGYSHEGNARAATADSPSRNEYRLAWNHLLPQQDVATLQYVWRESAYPTARADRRRSLDLNLRHLWEAGAYATLEYHHTANDSSDPGLSYSQNILVMGIGCDI